ncbi:hypothetical protein R8O96_26080, partial [Vibrio sp. 1291-1]|nr:hypothetical protein [Vibrio sp. 1291-1]
QQAELETQVKVTKHIKISAAGKQVEELNNEDEKGKGTLAGLRADYIWDSDNNVYIKGQKTVGTTDEYDENDSVTIGGETRILEDFVVGAEYTTGDRGDAAEAGVTYDVTEDYSTYLTYVDDSYEGKNNVIVGQRADLTSTVDFYQENQFVDEDNGKGRIDSFGFGYDMNDDIDMGIGYQKGEIEDDQNITTERQAVSVSTSIDVDDVLFKNKVEYRVDKTDDSADPDKKRIDQWVTTNRYTHHLTEEYTL